MAASQFDKPIDFKKGTVIFAEGEDSNFLYLIKSGEVRIFKKNQEKLIPITVVRDQEFIGELSMFSDEKRSATAVATQDSTLVMVKKNDIRKVLKTCPEWVTNIMVTISDRLRNSVDMLREHKIVDDVIDMGNELTPKEEKDYLKKISDYMTRKGITTK
ncbi:MAG: cyclic nucleotide-binding domain-containing protein [Halobacteriovoraceae bacterium]|jgi:CRP/FNR family transcriptional regulator, cyclic AMP receptor protein|nr:cyclic nucleotide-binding domain-containing protein [Halobacteriovoraceae bacterium]MBT5095391.1 cyclic nucleotide-binding domain-containing protein [Halobacteriovoraceae bacterium]